MLTVPILDRDLVTRIRMEFMEMPGLCLSEGQARRLWNLEAVTCARILALLVDEHFLTRSRHGSYLRTNSGRAAPADAA